MALHLAQKVFNLRVVGGNRLLDGALLCEVDSDVGRAVGVTSRTTSGSAPLPCLVRVAEDLSTLYVGARGGRGEEEEEEANPMRYYSLQGPSGKGEYRLKVTTDPHPRGLGLQILYDDWTVFLADAGRLLLRYKDSSNSHRWIAALEGPDEDGSETWVPWWYSPNAANMEDFPSYVAIDIELVEAESMTQDVTQDA